MAAEQSVALCPERRVVVLPTRTLPQGLSAMLAFNPDATPEQNADEMMAAAGRVLTGQITFAARDSEFGGFKIKEGEILALQDGKLMFAEKDVNKAALKLTKSMAGRDAMFVTVIYGEDVSDEQAEELLHAIENKLGSHVEVTLVKGGQPVYYYIISVE